MRQAEAAGGEKRLTRCFRVFEVASVWHKKTRKNPFTRCNVSFHAREHSTNGYTYVTDEEMAVTKILLFSGQMKCISGAVVVAGDAAGEKTTFLDGVASYWAQKRWKKEKKKKEELNSSGFLCSCIFYNHEYETRIFVANPLR